MKLSLDQDQQRLLQKTIEQFKRACQRVIDYGWNGDELKTYQKNKLHKATYDEIREEIDLSANLVVRARDRASEAIKGCCREAQRWRKSHQTNLQIRLNGS